MKKIQIISALTALTMAISGCSAAEADSAAEPEYTGEAKVLVAYFTHEGNNVFDGDLSDVDAVTSASVQRNGDTFPPQVVDGEHAGNTQIVANYILDYTGGDEFKIQVTDDWLYPIDPYDTLDVAGDESSEDVRPQLRTAVEDMDSYDVIYLGYPIWYGSFPQAVDTFLESYDFDGKVIVPFSTHDGSGLGRSVSEIKSLCPGADVRDGFSVRYSDVAEAREDVIQSINENQ